MSTITTAAPLVRHTPEEVLQLEGLYELVDGQLVEKQMGFLAGRCSIRIGRRLEEYAEKHSAGQVASEVTIQCFPDYPDLLRRPDISFFVTARAASVPEEGHVKIAPDLAVEVISPGDKINDFEDKLADYRSAGIRLVWEVNPTFRYVRIHRPDRTTAFLEENDELTGEAVLPGFVIKVADLMPSIKPDPESGQ